METEKTESEDFAVPGARLSQPQHVQQLQDQWNFVRSFGKPGCCGWDTRAPFRSVPAAKALSRCGSTDDTDWKEGAHHLTRIAQTIANRQLKNAFFRSSRGDEAQIHWKQFCLETSAKPA
jgi:hypothetical protein